ncbi:carbohydrate ABC transporter membrane protein 1 (CUT1 family) [Haloactinopolyspora alba]|uniref:Carbohydrate ABC transporter membrane protein 1 (CUT1 family) n=1 Tax=Haloactinopolyspora alba TaxID=648780 RepID=A0A2P8E542_9ACTN|nr:carbohydrate ABC transporter membrane protein 1 (CUT1 family) [Haloactinopolyspora alba]
MPSVTKRRERGPRARSGTTYRRHDSAVAVAFLSPAMIGFTVFAVLPVLGGLALGLFDWDLFSTPRYVGARNFVRLFSDPTMWQSLFVTLQFLLLGVIPTVLLGFMLAVLVNSKLPAVPALRLLFFVPMIASSAVTALVWAMLYNERQGFVNQALGVIGVDGPNWLSDTFWALPALVIVMIWSALPLVIILYLAGLQRVPDDIYAAASLDGAGPWRQLWSMTWPSVWPTTALVLALQAIGFLSGSFEMALLLTDGGPLGTTQSLALYAYRVAFNDLNFGYASALSMFQLVVFAAIVGIVQGVRRTLRKGGL